MRRPRHDRRRFEKRKAAQVSLRLLEPPRVVGVPLLEEKVLADDGLSRLDVERVGRAVDPSRGTPPSGEKTFEEWMRDAADPRRFLGEAAKGKRRRSPVSAARIARPFMPEEKCGRRGASGPTSLLPRTSCSAPAPGVGTSIAHVHRRRASVGRSHGRSHRAPGRRFSERGSRGS